MKKYTIAVLGAGNGGQAMAAYFGMAGYEVRLYDKFEEPISILKKQGYITLEGAVKGQGKIAMATNDIGEAVDGADLIMVVNPSIYHRGLAASLAPYIKDDQLIFLNPSSVFGAFAFKRALEEDGCFKKVVIAESNTLLFAARLVETGRVNIGGKKDRLLVAAFPADERERIYEIIRPVIPELEECDSVLETSFDSTNAMVHPLPVIMNASWEESGAKFRHYIDGIGPTVGDYIEKMDKERTDIGEKLGLVLGKTLFSIYMEYEIEYNTKGNSVSEVLKHVDAYKEIYAPNNLHNRYIYEDVPCGLVPFIAMGNLIGMPTKRMQLVVDLCSAMLNEDFENMDYSRNLDRLGLKGMSAEQIIQYAKTGVK